MKFVECRCKCGRTSSLCEEAIEKHTGGEASIQTIMQLIPHLRCSACSSPVWTITDEHGRLLFDRGNARKCSACGEFIPLPRFEAVPDTSLCTECARAGKIEPPPAPYPLPPSDQLTCKRCGAATVMRQRSEDLSWFVGCSSFPSCRWSYNI